MYRVAILGGFALVCLFLADSTIAQTATYDAAFDLDRDDSSGCTLTTSGGTTIPGIDARLQASVDTASQTVSEVNFLRCDGSSFSADSPQGGGYPAALNQGVNGADAIEMAVSQFTAAGALDGMIQLVFLADDGSGSDSLLTVDGSAGGPILVGVPFAVPGLTILGLLVLATILILATWVASRRTGQFMGVAAVMLIALAAWASQHAADGNLGEWTGTDPAALDPTGDSSNGSAAIDIVAAFVQLEDDTLYFRIDVADLENQPPEAADDDYATDEDTPLNVPAPGVLDNDSDAEGDPLTTVLDAGPANAASFVLNADGSFDYTPEADFNGSDSFTYFANDGQTNSAAATVTITVNPVNDPPTLVDDTASTFEEEPVEIDVLSNDEDVDGALDPASVSVTSPPANGTTSVDATTGVITYTKTGDFNGEDSFDYEACDDGTPTPVECGTATVTVTVEGVNDPPTFTPGGNVGVPEDSGTYDAIWASNISAGPPDESGQTLSFVVTGNDNPALFADGPSIDSAGNLSFTPADDANGTAGITVELTDDGGTDNGGDDTSAPASFTVSVEPVNDAPSFTSGGDISVLEDSGAYSQAWAGDISAGPPDESGQTLSFTVTGNDNAALFADGPSIDSAGNLSFTPVDNAFGTANITVELSDDGGTANGGDDTSAPVTFSIALEGVNDPPSFTAGGDIGVDEDSGTYSAAWASNIEPGAPNEGGQTLSFVVTGNDNPALFADGPSIDSAGNLSFTPADDANGTAGITVELTDDGGTDNGGDDTSAPASFTVSVEPVNDAPSFTSGGDISVLEDSGAYSQAWAGDISAGPPDESGQTLSFTVTGNDNAALFADGPSIDSAGNLSFTPVDNAFGTANITVELSDDGETANGGDDTSAPVTFSIALEGVNDPPSFTAGGDIGVDEDSGTYSAAWASNIEPGAPNEGGQTLSFVVTGNDNPALFADGPSIDSAGNLSFTPADDANGTAGITVELTDDGGTDNGGDDTSAPASFTVSMQAVNDPPIIDAPGPFDVTGNIRIQVPDGADDLLSDVSDPADGSGAEPFNVTTGSFTSAQGGEIEISADGSFTYDPPAGHEGLDSFEYEVCDSGVPLPPACATASVSLSVSDMIWFVDPTASAGGDGRLSQPFNDIDDLDAVNDGSADNPAAGDPIFLFDGLHDGELALLDGQQLFGASAGDSLSAMTGIVEPIYSDSLPSTGGSAPILSAINGTALTIASDNLLRGFDIGDTANGTDLAGSNFGTLTVSEVAISGSGQALDLTDGALVDGAGSPGFVAISSNGGSRNISLVNVDGTPTLGGGSLTGAISAGVYIDGGTGNLVFPGSVSHDGGRIVDVQNRTTGTVELSGNLSANGGLGIRINGNSGGSIILSGASKTISNTSVDAITVSSNSGADISFTNGGLEVAASGGLDGLFASGGGTLSITGAGNRIDGGAGSAVRIVDTTIGMAGITLERATSNGADIGIELQNTGTTGDFVVTGNGGPCTGTTPTCSGGRIQATVGVDGAAAGNGIRLDNTGRVELNRMRIDNHPNHAIFGSTVAGFTLADSVVDGSNGDSPSPQPEGAIVFANLTGSADITRSEVSGGLTDNLRVTNDSGILDRLVIEQSLISDNSTTADAENGIRLRATDLAEVNVTIDNSVLAAHRSDHFDADASGSSLMDVIFTNNTMTGGHPSPVGQSFLLSSADSAIVTFNVSDNTIDSAIVSAFTFFQGSGSTATSSMSGSFTGNEIGLAGVDGSGSAQGNGVTFNATGSGTLTALVDGNTIRQWSNLYGLLLQAGDESATLNATVGNNTLTEPNLTSFPANGLHLNAGTTAAGAVSACVDIFGNTLAGSGAFGADDFRLRQRNSSTVSLPGYGGAAGDTAAVVSFVQSNNTGSPSGSAAASGSGGGFVNTASCPTP